MEDETVAYGCATTSSMDIHKAGDKRSSRMKMRKYLLNVMDVVRAGTRVA
jgi:hypothetical protein